MFLQGGVETFFRWSWKTLL